MSAPHGCNDDMAVVESFKEALKQRIGVERYRMWFAHGVEFAFDASIVDREAVASAPFDATCQRPCIGVKVRGQFALERIRNNFLRELRGAAMQACGSSMNVELCLAEPPAAQADLPLHDSSSLDQGELAQDQGALAQDQGALAQDQGVRCDGVQGGSNLKHKDVASDLSPATDRTGTSRTHGRASRRRPNRRRTSSRSGAKSLSSLVVDGAGSVRRDQQTARSTRTSPPTEQLELPNLSVASTDGVSAGASPCDTTAAPNSSASSKRVSDSRDSGKRVADNRGSSAEQEATTTNAMTARGFVVGPSNQLAHTAMVMVCQDPAAASPLFVCGPTGTGKTHILTAIADQLRRRHRMRRVMHLSAEQFTNDFISSVGNSGITAFRRRYRDVDALLIDDIQFLGAKQATLREMLYTVETLSGAGRPLVFSGLQSPADIPGLSQELAGRLAAGLVCPTQPLDSATRETILRRWLDERCPFSVPEDIIEQLVSILAGDGRVIRGVVNLIHTLQRMQGRTPTMDELRRFGGDLLRSAKPVATLSVIEIAVCEAFHLPADTLRGASQVRAVTEPRMLAMFLSRQLTSSAYTEIARHFGGKSHSTAIAAEKNVKSWLAKGRTIGRGHSAMSAQEALDRVENLLRSG